MGIYDKHVSFSYSILSLAISISALIVGYTYESECTNGATNYLVYSGIIGVAVPALTLAFLISSCFSPCFAPCISLLYILTLVLILITRITVFIWGCIVIFPAYSQWTEQKIQVDEDLNVIECHEVPMLLAFSLLIMDAVMIFFHTIISLCGCCRG